MEEVDGIFLLTLQQAQVQHIKKIEDLLDSNKLIKTLQQLITEIEKDNSSFSPFPQQIPQEMVKKYDLCNKLGKYLKSKKYKGVCGFNQFLYPERAESRKLIQFLLELLDKQNVQEQIDVFQSSPITEIINAVQSWALKPATLSIFSKKNKYRFESRLTIPSLQKSDKPNKFSDKYNQRYYQVHEKQVKQQPYHIQQSTMINLEEQTIADQYLNSLYIQNEINKKIQEINIQKIFISHLKQSEQKLPTLDELLAQYQTAEQIKKEA